MFLLYLVFVCVVFVEIAIHLASNVDIASLIHSFKVYHYGFGTKVNFSKSLCSVTVKRGRIVPGGWATSRVARRRSGPSSPKFAISPRTFVAAHLERRPAARSGRSPHVRPMTPLFRPRQAVCCTFGPPRTEKWGHWPHVGGYSLYPERHLKRPKHI